MANHAQVAPVPAPSVLANPFQFHQLEIRTAVGPDGEAWFCAKDVFEALEIKWSGKAASLKNCPEKWQVVLYLQTTYGEKETIFLATPAVYQTIFRSNKPEALAFAQWVCEEVLPAIHRHGFFGTLDAKQRIAISKQMVDVATRLANTKDAMLHKLLAAELRDLCNLIGHPMPELTLIGKDYQQTALEGFN